jgi:iron complex outermembrane recepter protein
MIYSFFRAGSRLLVVPALAIALVNSSAFASEWGETDLGEISVTASRVATEIKDSPVTIEIIDQVELETVKFVDSVNELLNRIPGNSLTRNLRIPIGGKNYTINLVDGMAVRSFGSGTNGFLEEVNSFDIERVEVIKGPASSLYGSNALGGVINVITRKPPSEPEFKVWGEMGNHDRARGGISAAGSVDSFGYFFDANLLDYDGSQERTDRQRKTVSGKLIYDFDADTSLSVRGEYLETSEQGPGSLTKAQFDADWQQADIPNAFTDQQMKSLVIAYVTDLGEQSGLDIKYSLREHDEQGMPSWSATADYGEDEMLNHNLVATYHRDFDFYDSRLILGMDLLHSSVDEASHATSSPDSNLVAAESWETLAKGTSPFFQYEISPIERMRVTLGARYDKISYDANTFDDSQDEEATYSNVTPKAGFTFDLDDENSLWFGYSTGFVVPSRTNLFTSTRYITDPDLKPEEAENFEFGVRGRLLDDRVRYDVAFYNTTIEEMIVVEDRGAGPPPVDAYVNAGEVKLKGVETSLSVLPVDFLRFDVAHTYAKNKFEDYVTTGNDYSGNYMSSSPLHHVNARATWMPRHDLDIELEWDHISSYYTHDDNAADTDGKYQRPNLLHLRVTYEDGPWSIWGHVLNLTDKEYATRVSYSTRGAGSRDYNSGTERSIYAGVSYNW